MRPLPLMLAATLVLASLPARACLWDSDTIAEERSKFPTAMELLAGKYNRHSRAFYEWRIQDRKKKLEKDPNNFALLDDLGVALCKTGQFKEAVEVGEREVALDPTRYESQSNLGTYYIFAGDLDKSAQHIKAALAINPDAHFGREKYQLCLVEYLRAVRAEKGKVALPLRFAWRGVQDPAKKQESPWAKAIDDPESGGFASVIALQLHPNDNRLTDEERRAAIRGVLGMMRFADDELPILNEALGDLMHFTIVPDGDKQLAARAYLKAAIHAPDAAATQGYDGLAVGALELQDNTSYATLKNDFWEERTQGKAWMAQITADETRWIAEGKDPEAEFDKKYRQDPELQVNPNPAVGNPNTRIVLVTVGLGLLVCGIIASCGILILRRKKRQAAAKTPPAAQ